MGKESLIDRAVGYATHCHVGQVRKGSGVPYILQPMAEGTFRYDCGVDAKSVCILARGRKPQNDTLPLR